MEQKFEGTPKAEIRLEGQQVIRSDVTNDWGSRLQWVVRHDGQVEATPNARGSDRYEHPDKTPGEYQVVLQMWHYVNYRKDKDRKHIDSKFVDVSNTVSYKIEA